MPHSILVIGGGHAGAQVVASLRQEGFSGQLRLISAEAELPYQRPPLSKGFLVGSMSQDQLLLRPRKFYDDRNIELMLGQSVRRIDADAKKAILDDGTEIPWAELILATGSKPRKLSLAGGDLENVFYLRTLEDVNKIRSAMPACRSMVIIGGGYIGLEVAASARGLNKTVHVLEMEDRILKRVTSQSMSAFYHRVHQAHEVTIHTQTALGDLAGDKGKVNLAVTLDGAELPTDMVIIGVGVVPAIELAETAGIKCDNGILVDAQCRTSNGHVWAIGDCTNQPSRIFNRRLRLESVPNAIAQARVVAANLVGKDKSHDSLPWFWSDQYDLKLQMAGFSAGADTEVTRGDEASQKFVRFYWQHGVLKGVDSVNCPQEFLICRKIMEAGRTVDPDFAQDRTTDFKSLL